jgi:hypothetical protein
MNVMIATVGFTETLPAGGSAEGALLILGFLLVGAALLYGATRLLKRAPGRAHAARHSFVQH